MLIVIMGSTDNVTLDAAWSTADPAVAIVDGFVGSSGKLKILGTGIGTTNVEVEYLEFTAEYVVNVH
jgi:hypothetical protein